jgi:hypothetical protein
MPTSESPRPPGQQLKRTKNKTVKLEFSIQENILYCNGAEIKCNDLRDDDEAKNFGCELAGFLQGYFYEY